MWENMRQSSLSLARKPFLAGTSLGISTSPLTMADKRLAVPKSLFCSFQKTALLDHRCPFLFNLFQCLRDRVGRHARDPEVEQHAFCVFSPINTINEILAGSSIDVDRVHGDPLFVLMEGHCG